VVEVLFNETEVSPETPVAPEFSLEEPVAQGPPIPYQVPAFETDSPMAEITKPEPEELPAHLAKGVVAGTSMAGVGALRHSVESPSFAPQTQESHHTNRHIQLTREVTSPGGANATSVETAPKSKCALPLPSANPFALRS